MKRGMLAGMVLILTMLVAVWVISCGGGGSSNSSGFSGLTRTVNLGSWAPDMPISDSGTSSLVFSVNLGMGLPGGPYTYLIMDIEENLSGLTFIPGSSSAGLPAAADPLGAQALSMTIYVAPVDAADPCATGIRYGPFTVALDLSNQPESVTPKTTEATQSTLDIINVGAFSICIEIQSSVEASASQDTATFNACTETISDMAGTWEGTYYCTGNCPEGDPDDPLPVSLHITQTAGTPGYANYSDDFGAFYMGNVCGYSFSFDGGGPTYDESGIFIMDPSGLTATKTSFYIEHSPGTCNGTCWDTLSRVTDE